MIKASNTQDQALLEGLGSADAAAIRQTYDLALPAVIIWVKENNGSEADARDVFQEALIALFRKLERGELILTCTLKSFLRIMCRNLWLSRLRNKQHQASPLAQVEEAVDLGADLEQRLVQSEKEQLFFKHFDNLGGNCKKIMQWFFDKVPLKQIAERLDTSEGYIKKRKFKCKEQLIKAIQSDPKFIELNEGR